jgi:DtxR family Mn-dependent transcriptional regulator
MHKAFEEILEAIWAMDEEGDSSIEGVRRRCPIEVEPDDLALLVKRGLINREGDRVTLTEDGRHQARSVVRRHRLAECLFAAVLDIDAEKREAVACEVEHNLLPEVEEAICILLGHPTLCPDQKPIPPGRCCDAKRTTTSTVIVQLTSLEPGEQGRITFIKPKDHVRLHRLTSFGLTPGTIVRIHQRSPAFCIQYEGTELAINRDAAEDIYVTKIA